MATTTVSFIRINKIHESTGDILQDYIRADKIETFRRYIKNPSSNHPVDKSEGDVTLVKMKSINERSNSEYSVHVSEGEKSFADRLHKNGIMVIE